MKFYAHNFPKLETKLRVHSSLSNTAADRKIFEALHGPFWLRAHSILIGHIAEYLAMQMLGTKCQRKHMSSCSLNSRDCLEFPNKRDLLKYCLQLYLCNFTEDSKCNVGSECNPLMPTKLAPWHHVNKTNYTPPDHNVPIHGTHDVPALYRFPMSVGTYSESSRI